MGQNIPLTAGLIGKYPIGGINYEVTPQTHNYFLAAPHRTSMYQMTPQDIINSPQKGGGGVLLNGIAQSRNTLPPWVHDSSYEQETPTGKSAGC